MKALLGLTLVMSGICHAGEESLSLKDGHGRELTAGFCVTCHSLDYIEMNAPVMDKTRWEKTVAKMIEKFGAPIDRDDAATIVDYLSEHYTGGAR